LETDCTRLHFSHNKAKIHYVKDLTIEEKIIQIIPAPQGLVAEYKDFEDDGSNGVVPVDCLCLVEVSEPDGTVKQEVRAMTIDGYGSDRLAFAGGDNDFLGLDHIS